MKKRLYLKPYVIPVVYSLFVIALIISVFVAVNQSDDEENSTYVSGTILDENIPVINQNPEVLVTRPYNQPTVTIGKDYYDYQGSEEEQQNSILYHEGIYLQNTGIDYVSSETFDVLSILDGEVIEVKEEELLGKSVTIQHNNNVISVYQSLSEVSVKKGDQVKLGQAIGKSGTSELGSSLGNRLHFELTIGGELVDPENYFGKKVSELN